MAMPVLKTSKELATEAVTLAHSFSMVHHDYVVYLPTDYLTGDHSVTPVPERTTWAPQSMEDIQRKALLQFDTLFNSQQELSNFAFKVAQASRQHLEPCSTLLIRTANGLQELREDGKLYAPTGLFVPNTLSPVLNENTADQGRVWDTLVEWLDSEEEVVSLLRHLSTALAPGWSAVKYVMLLGNGRNGKSVLLRMIESLFGTGNTSKVTRQEMSEVSPVITHLNGKLVNIVYDGLARYLEDSSVEKTLVAGEPIAIRRLYQSEHTLVHTNALFIEGLNFEPKSRDKSKALQSRLVRFQFPNSYQLDPEFAEEMASERYVGALLGLLLQHYVTKDQAALMLAPTSASMDMQLEHIYSNSPALPFLEYLQDNDPLGVDALIGLSVLELAARFNSWRVLENDTRHWSVSEVQDACKHVLATERKSIRSAGHNPRKVRVVTAVLSEAKMFLSKQETKEIEGNDVVAE
jgi:phage/plasmid-associated DNA primase